MLLNFNLLVSLLGLLFPESVKIEKEIEFLFTTQPTADRPMPSDIKFVLEFSDEKRSSAHAGNELEKLEYIGTFLREKI